MQAMSTVVRFPLMAAVGNDRTLRLWAATTGAALRVMQGQELS